MGKSKKFFKGLIGKIKGRREDDQDRDEFNPNDGNNYDDIEYELNNRPRTEEYQSPLTDEDLESELFDDEVEDSPPEVFQVTDQIKQEVDQLDKESQPAISDDSEQPPEFHNNSKKNNLTEDRPIDIEAIKNYQMTDEDDHEEDNLETYQEFTPPKESKKSTEKAAEFLTKLSLKNFSLKKLSVLKKDMLNRASESQGREGFNFKRTLQTFQKKINNNSLIKKLKQSGGIQSWDDFIELIFGTRSRNKVHHFFLFALVIGSAYSFAIILSTVLKGGPQTEAPRMAHYTDIGDRVNYQQSLAQLRRNNLFNAKIDERTEPVIVEEDPEPLDLDFICEDATKTTRLPITLVNTVVLQDSVKSIAAVQVRGSRETKSLREGQKINDIAEINRIDRLRVILKNLETGECEYVATSDQEDRRQRPARERTRIVSPEEGRALMDQNRDDRIRNEGDNFQIQSSVRDEMLSNINEVLTQARAVQIRNPDGSYSFKMTEIVPGSIYSQLGIQNEDIITGINGDPITNINELMSLFGRIRDIDNFEIQVQRQGSARSFRYEFQ